MYEFYNFFIPNTILIMYFKNILRSSNMKLNYKRFMQANKVLSTTTTALPLCLIQIYYILIIWYVEIHYNLCI